MKIFICMFLAAIAFAAKPAQSVALKSSQLEVTFDPLKGLPVEYRLTSNKATLRGGADSDVGVTIFKAGRASIPPTPFDPRSSAPSKIARIFNSRCAKKARPWRPSCCAMS